MNLLSRLTSWVNQIGSDPHDGEEVRLQKSLLVRISLMGIAAGAIWGVIYYSFGESGPATIPLFYSAFSLLVVLAYAVTHRYQFFRFSQLLLILLLPFLV